MLPQSGICDTDINKLEKVQRRTARWIIRHLTILDIQVLHHYYHISVYLYDNHLGYHWSTTLLTICYQLLYHHATYIKELNFTQETAIQPTLYLP